jgi:hypothetical protein
MGDTNQMRQNWEIVTFGSIATGTPYTKDITFYVENPEILFSGTIGVTYRIYLWVRAIGSITPYDLGLSSAWLHAPTAPPDNELPLHLGVVLNTQRDLATHPYGQGSGSEGFMHVADLTRRVWDSLGVRYDSQNLYDLEMDTSFPLLAPRVFEVPANPEQLLQRNAWGPLMIVALKDAEGRRKLKDIRPPAANTDLSVFSLLDYTNSKHHRPRLVGREMVNSIVWNYHRITIPGEPPEGPGRYAVQVTNFATPAETLDWFITEELSLDPYESYDVDLIGRKHRDFNVEWLLADPNTRPSQIAAAVASGLGQPFLGSIVDQHSDFLLAIYQDGPMLVSAEISGSLAETMEEGDYAVVDCAAVKLPNPFTAARFGKLLVLVLSVTRYPAHAEIEYLIIRDALFFLCPDPLDETTWLLSPFDQATTVRVALVAPEPESGEVFSFQMRVRKNAAGGDQINMTVALTSNGVAVATWSETDISDTWTVYVFTLDASEQALIVDWSALFLDITRGGSIDSDPVNWRRLEISEIEAV